MSDLATFFLEAFFLRALELGKVPRIGVGSGYYMDYETVHVGFYNKQSPATSNAVTMFSKNGRGQKPAFAYLDNPYLKEVYQQAYKDNNGANKALIPRGKAT